MDVAACPISPQSQSEKSYGFFVQIPLRFHARIGGRQLWQMCPQGPESTVSIRGASSTVGNTGSERWSPYAPFDFCGRINKTKVR
jgi:hypothetical protein